MNIGPGLMAVLDEWERERRHGAVTLEFKAGNVIDVRQNFVTHTKDLKAPPHALFPELAKPKEPVGI